MTPRLISQVGGRETWQGAYRYELISLFTWFWRVEVDGRLVATVVEVHGQWRGWVGAICINSVGVSKDSEPARKSVVERVIATLEGR